MGGSSVLEKGSGEEVSIVYGQRQMPVDAPLHLNFGLVSYESSLARSSRAQEDQRAVVDSVVTALAPENVPVARQDEISGETQVDRWVDVDEVGRADQRDFAEVGSLREQCVEGPKGSIVTVAVPADDVCLESQPRGEGEPPQCVADV